MTKKLIIIGASGHGRVVCDIASLVGYTDIFFLDDGNVSNEKLLGKVSDFEKYVDTSDFVIAIGNNKIREKIFKDLLSKNANVVSLVHPNATVANDVLIGKGTVVMAGVVINIGAVLGDAVIVNTCSSVDHDCHVGDFSHISVGSHIAGTSMIGKRAFVCAGVTVSNNLSICDDCTIGAGAVVTKSITEGGTYVGVPAKKIK